MSSRGMEKAAFRVMHAVRTGALPRPTLLLPPCCRSITVKLVENRYLAVTKAHKTTIAAACRRIAELESSLPIAALLVANPLECRCCLLPTPCLLGVSLLLLLEWSPQAVQSKRTKSGMSLAARSLGSVVVFVLAQELKCLNPYFAALVGRQPKLEYHYYCPTSLLFSWTVHDQALVQVLPCLAHTLRKPFHRLFEPSCENLRSFA